MHIFGSSLLNLLMCDSECCSLIEEMCNCSKETQKWHYMDICEVFIWSSEYRYQAKFVM